MKSLFFNLFIFISTIAISQENKTPTINDALKKYAFLKDHILEKSDTITYYLKKYKTKPSKLVVYIQGTDPNPIFSFKKKNKGSTISRWFGSDYKTLDSTYTYAIIPKPGLEGIINEDSLFVPKKYYQKNYQEYRVNQIHQSINHIVQNHLVKPERIIVYGHSEGAVIAAELAKKNKYITHLGFWSGNVLNNFYEFSLFDRIETLQGKQSDSISHNNIMGILNWYQSVIENPNSTEVDHFGFTNKRWSSYETPPIENLLNIDIPIYAVFGTKDESTPIETAYLIPIQFMERRKNNLTFEVCIDCNHGYIVEKNGKKIKHWDRIFEQFISWTIKK
ncbi:hypothetical protein D7030_03085 [Flavobacteriaceae bacterium AU392]|nr:hypothetical protein D1817_09560 [Flavobacteriaceae bacterium]RKM85670.1 hypothetical protein D7030_03085 [Flavobacteriaceae bacterium AU392]